MSPHLRCVILSLFSAEGRQWHTECSERVLVLHLPPCWPWSRAVWENAGVWCSQCPQLCCWQPAEPAGNGQGGESCAEQQCCLGHPAAWWAPARLPCGLQQRYLWRRLLVWQGSLGHAGGRVALLLHEPQSCAASWVFLATNGKVSI